jgi:hypothetical protein
MNPPSLAITSEQITRLLTYLQTSRRQVLTQVPPSTERNAHQRLLQALQARVLLEREREPHAAVVHLVLSREEVTALQTMVAALLSATLQEPSSPQRNATLVDLSALKAALEKLAFRPMRHSARLL